jgi:hypothetical protein
MTIFSLIDVSEHSSKYSVKIAIILCSISITIKGGAGKLNGGIYV